MFFSEVHQIMMHRTSNLLSERKLKATTKICPVIVEYHTKFTPHQWPSGSAPKTGRREMPGSISGRSCRPSRSEFSLVFSETRVNTDKDPLQRPPRRALTL